MSKRFLTIACCVALLGGAASSVAASRFAACNIVGTPGIGIAVVNSPRKFVVTTQENCGAGDTKTCAWHENVLITKKDAWGVWGVVTNSITGYSGYNCSAMNSTTKDYPLSSSGHYKITVDIMNPPETVNYAHLTSEFDVP